MKIKQRILITGGAGNIGSSLVGSLILDKHNFVVVVDDLSTGFIDNLPSENIDNYDFVKCNVNRKSEIESVMSSTKFDTVFHYAAVVGVERTQRYPLKVLEDIEGIKAFQATLGQPSIINQDSNLFNNSMGGGSLLDLGVYPIFWSQFLFGPPTRVQSNLYSGNTDVDITSSILLNYDQGRQANISSSIVTRFANNGIIYGTKGAIEIHQPLYCPTAVSIIKYKEAVASAKNKKSFLSKILDKLKSFPILQNLYVNYPLLGQYILKNRRKTTIYFPIKGNGLQYMAEEVSNYLINQPMDSKIIPLTVTMSISETIHQAKSELGTN